MTENDLRVHTVGWHFSTPKSMETNGPARSHRLFSVIILHKVLKLKCRKRLNIFT
uniref:Uncharacterized protein n=1 Tax=Anopheles quadriannulatus TaxID=34691 RepID=A0A182XQC4_ANOQN